MTDPNRVLVRKGARELGPEELDYVCGGLGTKTKCTASPDLISTDGDTHEC